MVVVRIWRLEATRVLQLMMLSVFIRNVFPSSGNVLNGDKSTGLFGEDLAYRNAAIFRRNMECHPNFWDLGCPPERGPCVRPSIRPRIFG